MTIDDRLAGLRARGLTRKHVKARLEQALERRTALQQRAEGFARVLMQERKDVARLEGLSIGALIARLSRTRDKKLAKERAEVLAAKVKLEDAEGQYRLWNEHIVRFEEELASFEGLSREYERLLLGKGRKLKARGGPLGRRLASAEKWEAELMALMKEFEEAQVAGKIARKQLKRLLGSLEEAKAWGTFDLWGRGLLVTAIKRDHAETANGMVAQTQVALSRFARELGDVGLSLSGVPMLGWTKIDHFSDSFFDGFFGDFEAEGLTVRSYQRIALAARAVDAVMHEVGRKLRETEAAIKVARRARRALIARK